MEILILLLLGVLFLATTVFMALYTSIAYKNNVLLKANRQITADSEEIQEQNEALVTEQKRVIASPTGRIEMGNDCA